MITADDFGAKIESYRKPLMRVALKLCAGNHAAAEDMVQEAMLKAIANKDKFRSGNLRAWVMRILQNCCISAIRRRSRMKREHVNLSEIVATPSKTYEISDELQSTINKLPPEYRRILMESANDVTCNDIAAALGIPVGTVLSRLFRTRKFLQNSICDRE